MKSLTAMIIKELHVVRLKYRFPKSIVYPRVTLGAKNYLGANLVVFVKVDGCYK
jgi:hypothetical protein